MSLFTNDTESIKTKFKVNMCILIAQGTITETIHKQGGNVLKPTLPGAEDNST